MIAVQAIRETRMNKVKFLKTASVLRTDKAKTAGHEPATVYLPRMAGLPASFEAGAARLSADEREQFISSLKQMLDRERRRCRARAGSYDAGRHIGLYMAIKMLNANKSPGA